MPRVAMRGQWCGAPCFLLLIPHCYIVMQPGKTEWLTLANLIHQAFLRKRVFAGKE